VQEKTEANVGADGQLQLAKTSGAADANSTARDEPAKRSVERVDVSVNTNGQISLRQEAPQANESPTGIMLVQVAQQANGLQIEIADFRRSEVSQYRATLPDGSPLPDWIKVDAATGKVTIDSARAGQLIALQFIAQDASGSIRTLEIKIDLSEQRSQNNSGFDSQPQAMARPVFMSQVADHHRQWDGYGEQLLSVFTE
jgi:hypothetical protein